MNFKEIFVPTVPIGEVILRGTLMYLFLFVLLRFVLKREAGRMGLADILLIVLIADAAQNGMAGKYESLTNGFVLVTTLVFWNYALDWLAYHNRLFARLVHPPPLLLVKDGRMLRKKMRRELITADELHGLLREQGVELAEVQEARMEGDGGVSVMKRQDKSSDSDTAGRGAAKEKGI